MATHWLPGMPERRKFECSRWDPMFRGHQLFEQLNRVRYLYQEPLLPRLWNGNIRRLRALPGCRRSFPCISYHQYVDYVCLVRSKQWIGKVWKQNQTFSFNHQGKPYIFTIFLTTCQILFTTWTRRHKRWSPLSYLLKLCERSFRSFFDSVWSSRWWAGSDWKNSCFRQSWREILDVGSYSSIFSIRSNSSRWSGESAMMYRWNTRKMG